MGIHQIVGTTLESDSNRIVESIARALAESGRFRQAELEISTSGDDVLLVGRVTSYYQKQVAQTAALHVIGPRNLVNEIEVE